MRVVPSLLIWVFLLLWAALAVQGFIAFQTLEPTDSGFTRGFNRISAFLTWQAYALAAAVAASMCGRWARAEGLARLAARAPLWISGGFFIVLIFGFAALVIYTRVVG